MRTVPPCHHYTDTPNLPIPIANNYKSFSQQLNSYMLDSGSDAIECRYCGEEMTRPAGEFDTGPRCPNCNILFPGAEGFLAEKYDEPIDVDQSDIAEAQRKAQDN